jgi:hypothetical protein
MEDKTMVYHTGHPNHSEHLHKMTTALRDGLIALAGFGIAAGSILNQEITMWWMGW